MTRLVVVGNLDCEVEWAGGPPLPAHVAAKIAAAASLLRALAPDGDDVTLWTPAAVDAARIPAVPFAPACTFVSGALPAIDRAIAWGATRALVPSRSVSDSVSDSVSASVSVSVSGSDSDPVPDSVSASDSVSDSVSASVSASASVSDSVSAPSPLPAPWRDLLPTLALTSPATASAASDRRLALALAARLGIAPPGATVVTSVDALAAHLAAGGADASPTGAWVVKSPLSAAGRDRVRRRGAALDTATAQRVSRLLARSGALVFEPWLDRVLDLGQPGIVDADRWYLLPPHRLHSDVSGGFAGITIDDDAFDRDPALARHRAALAATAAAVATALGALGYRGPFTVDAFVHRDADHREHLQPLVEINPRLSFGLVARAWAERAGTPLTFRLGAAPPAHATTLLLPTPVDPTAAWLEPVDQTSSPPARGLDAIDRSSSR